MTDSGSTVWAPDLIFTQGRFANDSFLVTDTGNAQIAAITKTHESSSLIPLKNRAMLHGLVNAHSHAFQRVIRGRTERRSQHTNDSFWTWREQMYGAAN